MIYQISGNIKAVSLNMMSPHSKNANLADVYSYISLPVLKPSKVLFLRNLPRTVTYADALSLVSHFSTTSEPKIILQQAKCQGFVEFATEAESSQCLRYYSLNPIMLKGCSIQISYSNRAAVSSLTPKNDMQPGRVLLVHVINLLYPVNIEMLHQIFSKYGIVERIITFQKDANVFQAFIQFDTVDHAARALSALDNENIYTGCNSLRVQFSNFMEITVKYNNNRSRDYTNPDLPVCGDDTIEEAFTPPRLIIPSVPEMSCVVIVYNLDPAKFTVEGVFNLLSFYGHVTKVKFLHSKPDAALVQFAELAFATLAIQLLDGAHAFDQQLHVDYAKMAEILLPTDAAVLLEDHVDVKYRFFTMKERRYGSNLTERVMKNACKPTHVLHAANISPDISEETVRAAILPFGKVDLFKWLDNVSDRPAEKTRMALMQFETAQVATEVLVLAHNLFVRDRQVKLSFSKSSI